MASRRDFELAVKSVVVVDLLGYSSLARTLQEVSSAISVAELNRRIQSFVEEALTSAGGDRETNLLQRTGDGAILIFDTPGQAVQFGLNLQSKACAHNASAASSPEFWFRIGAATGELSAEEAAGGTVYAGITIANAVRLEAACKPGEILVDVPTWSALGDALRCCFAEEEDVAGKREERFRARRLPGAGPAPTITEGPLSTPPAKRALRSTFDDRQRNYWLINQIEDDGDVDKLIYLIDMPPSKRPSSLASLNSRQAAILIWAASAQGCGHQELQSSLELILRMREVSLTGASHA